MSTRRICTVFPPRTEMECRRFDRANRASWHNSLEWRNRFFIALIGLIAVLVALTIAVRCQHQLSWSAAQSIGGGGAMNKAEPQAPLFPEPLWSVSVEKLISGAIKAQLKYRGKVVHEIMGPTAEESCVRMAAKWNAANYAPQVTTTEVFADAPTDAGRAALHRKWKKRAQKESISPAKTKEAI